MDENASLFERYGALFSLRNIGDNDTTTVLARVLRESRSALLKHEVCYVFGQLQHAAAVEALRDTLNDVTQHAMVRHEAAEALGSIATDECRACLQRHLTDNDPIVAEGCLVALDILSYELSGELHYCA